MSAPDSSSSSHENHSVHRILLVDDTPSIHDDYRKILTPPVANPKFDELEAAILGPSTKSPPRSSSVTFDLVHAHQGEEALELTQKSLATNQPLSVAFVDMRMPPGWDGLETTRRLRECDPRLQIVICTAYSDHTWARITEVLEPGDNVLILKKPFDSIEALQLAHTLAAKWSLQRQVENRIDNLDSLARNRGHALEAAEQRFAAAFLAGARAYAILDLPDGRILQTNPAFLRLLDLSAPPDNRKFDEVLGWHRSDQLQSALSELSDGKSPADFDVSLPSETREKRYIRISGSPFIEGGSARALFSISDISESRNLEQQLHRSQKMEAMGSLAAGVAHDFNNVLTVISGFTSVVQLDDGLSPTTRGQLDQVINAAERAANLTRQLLIFSRRKSGNLTNFDPAAVALGMQSMLSRLIRESIVLEWKCPAGICTINADESGFEQILMNLLLNARDAIADTGTISIEINPVEAQRIPIQDSAIARSSGQYVWLKVTDTGSGMSPEVLSHIFEPFYTSKAPDKGTGLGLATVYGIVKRHHGWINVSSEPGEGTTFDVYFPLSGTTVPDSASPLLQISASRDRNLRILVVEDDPAVRDLLEFMLVRHQFDLCVVEDGPAAVKLWHEENGKFDLLLSDLVLPRGMNGRELAAELRTHNPNLPVIITSGYAQDSNPPLSGPTGPEPIFISKPYNSASLMVAIESAVAPVLKRSEPILS